MGRPVLPDPGRNRHPLCPIEPEGAAGGRKGAIRDEDLPAMRGDREARGERLPLLRSCVLRPHIEGVGDIPRPPPPERTDQPEHRPRDRQARVDVRGAGIPDIQ